MTRAVIPKTLAAAASYALNSAAASIPSAVRLQIPNVSWDEFAENWRKSDMEFCSTYDDSSPTFITSDQHYHSSLVQLLADYKLTGLWNEEEVLELSRVWHFLDGWPDSSKGLEELSKKFQIGTLSNGTIELLDDLKHHARLPWNFIFSSETFKAYKPSPIMYTGAAEKLGLETHECALVAAHIYDLKAAKSHGFQTIYVEREGEETLSEEEVQDAKAKGLMDMWISVGDTQAGGGFLEIAKRFEGA